MELITFGHETYITTNLKGKKPDFNPNTRLGEFVYSPAMLSRLLAYCLVWIGGIAVWAHDLVPHYHKEVVEQSRTYSLPDEKNQSQNNTAHKHKHDCYSIEIRQAVILASSGGKLLESDGGELLAGNSDLFTNQELFSLYLSSPPDIVLNSWETIYYFTNAVVNSRGSRAPPHA